ncbi:Pex21p Ecym_2059 [Eremothecium cymbalariae DBVPG|uniref:PEX18/PEX21 C-terminal domain-containing protein n=1 Tax=Eremothecium cymbalariae (strain CBS 270.75 / DBVPG 7215 / KCTC 17166 / NRRL Y-17582) TaxID=931890 RepID=G8JP16_ERECY|nr:Hypothetical protein Ecym_2059 [Eremothecium cymbalariae DBVPG\
MSVCQGSAMQKLIAKADNQKTVIGRVGAVPGIVQGGRDAPQVVSNAEERFLQRKEVGGGSMNPFTAISQPHGILMDVDRQNVRGTTSISSGGGKSMEWIQQFHGMKLNDSTEFQRDYKQMYADYEQQQHKQREFAVNSSESMFLPAQGVGMSFVQQQLQLRQEQHQQHRQQEFEQLETFLEKEFESLESELQQQQSVDTVDPEQLDDAQREFQETAKSVYSTLSSEEHQKRFQGSKFLGLMRKISDGDVTLRKQVNSTYTGLYAPVSGITVGNEYWPVEDETAASASASADQRHPLAVQLEDILDGIEDLSGLSSTEAAIRVLH